MDFLPCQLAVLVTQRIDGGIDQKLRNRQSLGKLGQRHDSRVVPDHVRAQKLPYRPLRGGDVDMTAPDPLGAPRTSVDQCRRLRIVNHGDVRLEIYPFGILPIALYVCIVHVGGEMLFHPLQGVVEALGRPVERLGAGHHLPA